MLSRVAESIYWLARYIERAENTARIVNVNANLLLDLPIKLRLGWQPLIEITGSKELFATIYEEASERNVVRFLVSDMRNSAALLSSVHQARENARTIRDILPREAWEKINAMYLEIKSELPGGLSQHRRFDFLNQIIASTQQITGMLAGTMLNDAGYQFLRLGRNLERADMTTRIVDVRSESLLPESPEELLPFEHIQWMSVLQSLSAYQSYLQKIQGPVRRREVLSFLLQNAQFPRAFVHCMGEVKSCLQKLPRNREAVTKTNALISLVKRTKTANLAKHDLHKLLDNLQLHIIDLHGRIQNTYFLH